jgi:hypothetical protein
LAKQAPFLVVKVKRSLGLEVATLVIGSVKIITSTSDATPNPGVSERKLFIILSHLKIKQNKKKQIPLLFQ